MGEGKEAEKKEGVTTIHHYERSGGHNDKIAEVSKRMHSPYRMQDKGGGGSKRLTPIGGNRKGGKSLPES